MSRRNFEECGASHYFAISWKWMLEIKMGTLIVLHDSLLPRYRGFNPLVSALINGDRQIGVTALYAGKDFDTGDIIAQKSAEITYPIRIQRAIDIISDLYSELVNEITAKILAGKELEVYNQDLSLVTYSLWRDEMDYLIDWNRSADYIKRFIDSVGIPYKGASSYIEGTKVRILDSEVVDDVVIINRTPGKILFKRDGYPIVVCGKGLLKILELVDDEHHWDMLRDLKFRVRFMSQM